MSKTPDSIFDFPQDIIFNILSRLPAKSLLRFRCVCTSAPPLISHPSFTKLHLTSSSSAVADDRRTLISYISFGHNKDQCYYFHLSPLTLYKTPKLHLPCEPIYRWYWYRQFAGSSKGLICFFYSDSFESCFGTLILWNPSINKYKILDGPHNRSFSLEGRTRHPHSLIVFGFGFVSRTCEFKVVGIVYNEAKNKTSGSGCSANPVVDKNNTVFVYSLSTNSWEIKEGVSAPFNLERYCSTATFVNGFVNWLVYKEDKSRVIMAFDLDNERFQVYDLPKDIAPNYYDHPRLNSFGEEDSLSLSLSFCACYPEGNPETWDVWVMGEYGVVDSWKKLFVITNHDFLSYGPLVMKSEREVLILAGSGRLVLFDAIKNKMQDLGPRDPGYILHALSYTASLALLDD